MLVRLTVKLADMVNGVDLSQWSEGDVIELPARAAAMLIAEGWAELVPEPEVLASFAPHWNPDARAVAADRPPRRTHDGDPEIV
jgi:hypothetical protein